MFQFLISSSWPDCRLRVAWSLPE